MHALAQKKLKYRENTAKALFSKINNVENDNELKETWQLLNTNFKTLTQSKDSVKQLRQTILQLAIKGKLTEQWRNENSDIEPASVLFEKIKAEKEQLLKDGKVKKGKKQPPATTTEISVPSSWLITELDDISQYITDGTHQTPKYVEKGRMFLSAQNIKPFKFMPEIHKFVSEEAYQYYVENRKAEKGDILVGRVGSKGEAAVVDRELDFAIYVSLGLIKTFQKHTSLDFLAIIMNSLYGYEYASGNMSSLGASAGNFNLGRIRAFPIPFPPLEEQKQIVSKVNELMAWCDELEQKITKRDAYQERIMQAVAKQAI